MSARASGLIFAVVLSAFGCVVPPEMQSCEATGTCKDSCIASLGCPIETPICDAETAMCRACVSGDDRGCRERSPDMPRCVGGRCVECVSPRGIPGEAPDCSNSDGTSAKPICDGNVCRPCERHSECLSGVCSKLGPDGKADPLAVKVGTCVPQNQILIVDQELCSSTGPIYCTPQEAFLKLGSAQRYVLLRKSAMPEDFSSLTLGDFAAQAAQLIYLIGPLADNPPHHSPGLPKATIGGVPGKDGLSVSHGRVILEGLYIQGNRNGLNCTNGDANISVVRSFFTGNTTAINASAGCKLNVSDTWIGSGPAGTGFFGLPGNQHGIEINGADFNIANTMFVDDGDYHFDALGGVHIRAMSTSGALSTIINTTFYQMAGLVKMGRYLTTFMCDVPTSDRLVIWNSLFFSDAAISVSPEERYIDPACAARVYSVGSNDSSLTGNSSQIFAQKAPLFLDAAGRDLRPELGSDPAEVALAQGGKTTLDVSSPAGTVTLTAPKADLDGVPRGQASSQNPGDVALGAFEPAAMP